MADRQTVRWLLAAGWLVFSAVGCSTATDRAATAPASRVLVYPPRVDLQFHRLDGSGAIVRAGKRSVSDPLYLTRAGLNDGDRLYYEKLLLGGWLRREFASSAPTAGPSP